MNNLKGENLCFLDLEMFCSEKFVDENSFISVGIYRMGDKKAFYHLSKPYRRVRMSNFCSNLTGLTKEDLLEQPANDVVLRKVMSFVPKNYKVVTWGDTDTRVIRNVCNRYGLNFNRDSIDLSLMVSKSANIKSNLSLKNVAKICDIPIDSYRNHNALDDSILLHDIFVKLVDNPQLQQEIRKHAFQKELTIINKRYLRSLENLKENFQDVAYCC